MRSVPLSSFFFVLSLAIFVHVTVGQGSGSDACPCDAGANRSALMELYMATQGPSWGPGANWGASGLICAWVGLSCNGTGLIMNLESFNLNGTLPDDFGAHLANLESLNIVYSPSFGMEPWPLPASLGLSRGLKSLYLSGSFEGPLPEEWSSLSQLSTVDINTNFSGRVPSWAGMTRLEMLGLYSTAFDVVTVLDEASLSLSSLTSLCITANLTGVLPSSWANLTRLQTLNIQSYGAYSPRRSLPESWGAMKSLRELVLFGGVAGWTLPASWEGMTALKHLDLSRSTLVGTLPHSWSALRLEVLYLSGNSFTGPLPEEWSSMVSLQHLGISFNRLTGPLPASWSALQNLQQLSLRGNGFSGELPASWAALQNLVELELSSNSLSGSVPDTWWNFSPRQLNLRNNKFNGTVPRNWTMRQGSTIDLSQNAFTGTLPSLVNATAPTFTITFTANRNNFTGPLPSAWYEDPNFLFNVNHNQLSGTPDLCAFNQSDSSLSYNDFTGAPNISCFGLSPCTNSFVLQGFLTGNHFCSICGLPNCTCNDLPDHSIADDSNIAVLEVKSSDACCQACRANTACVAAVLVPYHKYTYCYLKNTTTPLVPKPGHTVLLRAD